MKFFNMKKNSLKLEYDLRTDWTFGIDSAKNHIPDWYKKHEPFDTDIKKFPAKINIKGCVPFLESLTTGYMALLPFDIAIEKQELPFNSNQEENKYSVPLVSWQFGDLPGVSFRDGSEAPFLPTPEGYNPAHFIWQTHFSLRLPKGYSCILTHPLNRYDLPFLTMSAVVDVNPFLYNGSIPFFIKNNFEGVIKGGTPFLQIIPFKTEDWKKEKVDGLHELADLNSKKSLSTAYGWYKKNSWVKKTYS